MCDFQRPFPALTQAQRLHLDVFGYVVIENAISSDLVKRLCDTAYALEEAHHRGQSPAAPAQVVSDRDDYFRVDNIVHLDDCFLEYVTQPHLVGMAEEAIGSEARLEQSDIHIRKPIAKKVDDGSGFHRGAEAPLVWQSPKGGLTHCHFVKALTNLTDLGPGDGGTKVVAGSHKMTHISRDDIMAGATDSKLIHTVEAPAGSTLLFFESTIHCAGFIESQNDRLLIVGGYASMMMQPWIGFDLDPKWVETSPEKYRVLLSGSKRYSGESRVRGLDQPSETL